MPAPLHTHVERVMGTIVGIAAPEPLPVPAVEAAVNVLHEADRVFSTWNAASPMSLVRAGKTSIDELDREDAVLMYEVLEHCALARAMTGGAFDPWAMPGGVDPTGLVKGWAAERARRALAENGVKNAIVNAGGDIAVLGNAAPGRPWRVGVRRPDQPDALCAVVEVACAIATSGDYERTGQLIEPRGGAPQPSTASATVTGPALDLADALATGLAVAGAPLLPVIDELDGYEAYLITGAGRHYATRGVCFR